MGSNPSAGLAGILDPLIRIGLEIASPDRGDSS